jgi:dipeptidyl aminopeptidase/acylaminoacyl peptidase
MVEKAQYGSWRSPITPQHIAMGTVRFEGTCIDGREIYWTEGRPLEGGRNVIVKATDGSTEDFLPAPFNSRSRVHEYGGGSFISVDGIIYFANFSDQRVYRVKRGTDPEPLTPEAPIRYADFVHDGGRDRLLCVIEDHHRGDREALNSIASIDVVTGKVRQLASGHDFYSSPRINPSGDKLAWITWDHPNMPWDSTELWLADILSDGNLGTPLKIAGGPGISVIMPQWSPGGQLHYISDGTGWWNIWKHGGDKNEQIIDLDAEFGLPHWIFGMSTYGFISDDRILCAYTKEGTWKLAEIETDFGDLEERTFPFTDIHSLKVLGDQAVMIAGSPSVPASIIRLDLSTDVMDVLKRSSECLIDPGYLSRPEAIHYLSDGRNAHAMFYPPLNQDFEAPDRELPPLIVISHGGPTGAAGTDLNPKIQYWTSRGFAVLDVNYGGSTGYGREYRELLKGNWGIVDVEDCSNGARVMAIEGRVDRSRMAIRGGSAGGYTTLAALAFKRVFKAGASYFGVSDPSLLAKETHKFESRYLDGLIGPYPEKEDLYLSRSPLHHADRIVAPVIFFQGLDDKIVLPDQAEKMVDALRENGIPVAYLPFEGEQHGFRRAENIIRSLEAELYFYSRVFGFDPADELQPVDIQNMQ